LITNDDAPHEALVAAGRTPLTHPRHDHQQHHAQADHDNRDAHQALDRNDPDALGVPSALRSRESLLPAGVALDAAAYRQSLDWLFEQAALSRAAARRASRAAARLPEPPPVSDALRAATIDHCFSPPADTSTGATLDDADLTLGLDAYLRLDLDLRKTPRRARATLGDQNMK
jgi:hypothetical protein